MQVVSFGDSLSDVGTYSQIKLGFGGGRLHDQPGPGVTQNVAQYYGDTLQPANQGGFGIPLQRPAASATRRAAARDALQPGIGHADASVPNPDYAQATTTPIADQAKQYLAQHGSFNAGQIVLINGGANDIFYQAQVAQAQGNTPAAQLAAAQAIGPAAQQLGASSSRSSRPARRTCSCRTCRTSAASPLAPKGGTQAAFTQLSGFFNQTLAGTLAALQVDPTKHALVDTFTGRTASRPTTRRTASA
jgi:hypothetical protein